MFYVSLRAQYIKRWILRTTAPISWASSGTQISLASLSYDWFAKLDFGYDVSLFYSIIDQKIDQRRREIFLAEDLEPSYYHWILELAKNKSDRLPCLQYVGLFEATRERHALFSTEEWDPPLSVDYAFDDAGIDLEVHVRIPRLPRK